MAKFGNCIHASHCTEVGLGQVHMAEKDYAALLDACVRLGDASRGGDPQLWTEVLEFFGAQPWDCSQQVNAA